MKKKFLSWFAIWILVFGITGVAHAASMLDGSAYFEDYPFMDNNDLGAGILGHTLSSEVDQTASVLTSSGYGFGTSGDWDLSSASAAPLNVTVGQSSVSSSAESGFRFDNNGNQTYDGNEFDADFHLESDISADKIASASGSYSATNYITVDSKLYGDTPYVFDIWSNGGGLGGRTGCTFQYSPDSDFSNLYFHLDGYVDYYNLTQSTSNLNPFSADIWYNGKDGVTTFSSGIRVDDGYILINDGVLLVDSWWNNFSVPYSFTEYVNFGDISKISIGYNYTATIWESEPVPEPATMLLLGTGLTGLAATRLRRKKSA